MTPIQEVLKRLDALEARVKELEANPPKKNKAQQRAAIIKADCDKATATPLPLGLQFHTKFKEHWQMFCAWRTKLATTGRADGRKFDWTSGIAERLLNRCDKWGASAAISAILNSLDRYPDLYQPEDMPAEKGSQPQQQFVI